MTNKDRRPSATGQCLTDGHMQIAAQILKNQFLKQKRLQGTVFAAESRAEWQRPGSVQIHHNGSNHWVVSTMQGQDVLLHDSRYTGEVLPDALKAQLLEVYGSSIKRVLFPRVKQQEGAKDCGCFAINCYLLCNEDDPAKHRPDQEKLRDYLLTGFEEKQFDVLPSNSCCCATLTLPPQEGVYPYTISCFLPTKKAGKSVGLHSFLPIIRGMMSLIV